MSNFNDSLVTTVQLAENFPPFFCEYHKLKLME